MNTIRYQPWNASNGMHSDIRQVFDRFFNADEGDQSDVVTSQWAPRVDVREEDDRFVIFADIPGVDPKDIEVTMEKGILSLKGERSAESRQEGQKSKFTRIERSHGLFYRRFALPDSANPDGIKAVGRHGVLEITIPKRPETAPRRITIDS